MSGATNRGADGEASDKPTGEAEAKPQEGGGAAIEIPPGLSPDLAQYVEAVRDGHNTAEDVANALSKDYSNASKQLKKLAEDRPAVPLARERAGRSYRYFLEKPQEGGATAAAGQGGGAAEAPPAAETAAAAAEAAASGDIAADGMTIERPSGASMEVILEGADMWDGRTPNPDTATDYRPQNGEWSRAMAKTRDYAARSAIPGVPGYWLVGPTGCGKTVMAEALGAELEATYYEINVGNSLDGADLIGYPVEGADGQLRFAAGPITNALWASRKRPVVVVLDEVNRAPSTAKDRIFSALDERARVTLDAAGGAVIQGDPDNLVVVSTANEGHDYDVDQAPDLAERGRIGKRVELDYLGVHDPDAEAEVIASQTPASWDLARLLTEAANAVRSEAADEDNREISRGVPTRYLIDAAGAAVRFAEDGLDAPVWQAVKEDAINNHYYDSMGESRVKEIMRNYVDIDDVKGYTWDGEVEANPDAMVSDIVHVGIDGAGTIPAGQGEAEDHAPLAFTGLTDAPDTLEASLAIEIETASRDVGRTVVKDVCYQLNTDAVWTGDYWEVAPDGDTVRELVKKALANDYAAAFAPEVANQYADAIPGFDAEEGED